MLRDIKFPEPSPETLILLCGNKEFHANIKQMLFDNGYTAEMVLG